MKLSVIICVYNTKIEYFESCLKSLRSESCGEDIEICVLDDGSSIDYSELVQKYRLKYKRTENRGILAARLSAVEMASGDYIAFCDSDDTVSFDFHRPMVECAERELCSILFKKITMNVDGYCIPLRIFYKKSDKPLPTVVYVMHTAQETSTDIENEPNNLYIPIEDIVNRGYAVCVFYFRDVY